MYLRLGFLGHALTVHFGPEFEDSEDVITNGIGGGAGGSFERCAEVDTDFLESEPWEEEDRFGFR